MIENQMQAKSPKPKSEALYIVVKGLKIPKFYSHSIVPVGFGVRS